MSCPASMFTLIEGLRLLVVLWNGLMSAALVVFRRYSGDFGSALRALLEVSLGMIINGRTVRSWHRVLIGYLVRRNRDAQCA